MLPRVVPPVATSVARRGKSPTAFSTHLWGMDERRDVSANRNRDGFDRTPMWTVEDLCEKLHASPETVRSWRKRGVGPRAFKIGRHVLFEEADVRAWIEAHEISEPSTVSPTDADRGTGW